MIFDNNKVRSVFRSVVKEILAPVGFRKAKRPYVRQVGDQLHGFDIQKNKYGGSYTINLAFSYTFFRALGSTEEKPLSTFGILDFLINSRLCDHLGRKIDWWEFDVEIGEFERRFADNCRESLRILDECSERWRDPAWFLERISPEELRRDIPIQSVKPNTPSGTETPAIWRILPEWCPTQFEFGYFLAMLACRRGDYELALDYVQVSEQQLAHRFQHEALAAFKAAIENKREGVVPMPPESSI